MVIFKPLQISKVSFCYAFVSVNDAQWISEYYVKHAYTFQAFLYVLYLCLCMFTLYYRVRGKSYLDVVVKDGWQVATRHVFARKEVSSKRMYRL